MPLPHRQQMLFGFMSKIYLDQASSASASGQCGG